MVPVVNPLQAALLVLVTNIVALVVAFGVINDGQAQAVVPVVTASVSVAFLIANSLHHQANAKIVASKGAGR